MSKILIIQDKKESDINAAGLLSDAGYEIKLAYNEAEALDVTNSFSPDIALIDTACSDINISNICKKLKLQSQTNDIQIVLLTSKDSSSDKIMVGADGYITKPFNDSILIATVNAHLRIKKLLDILYTNNSELAKSLYQMNVLYNTSSQLAGTLDKAKLIDIMNTGLEKSLSFSLCVALIINDPEDATLIINSLHPVTETLEHALKLRAMIGYKGLFENNKLPFELSINNIKVENITKFEKGSFDINIFEYDSLFSPISTSDKFFGTVEILREQIFTGEDSTCFQTVVKQVSLPLESAILYDELKKTNIKLEKLEKLKSEFISIVSHELRTPLTSIKNSLDIMISGKTGEINKAQNNFLTIAKRNVDRLSGIINDLLDLSKIEAGKMQYRFEPVNILDPIEFVKSTFDSLAEKKNIKIIINVCSKLSLIYGDINRIEQILSNLVSNAIKFTPENGQIKINIEEIKSNSIDTSRFYRDSSSVNSIRQKGLLKGDYIRVTVEDNGIGIKEEDIPKVFDKFQQIENSLSREVGGTGLGLPIAKQLLEAHRGEIWLESEFNKGSKFSLIFPVMLPENRFLLELDNALQQAKYSHSNLAVVFLKESFKNHSKKALEKSIIKDMADGKISIGNCSQSKMFYMDNEMQIILTNTDRPGTDYIINSLKSYLSKNKPYFNSDLSLGVCVYPEDAITSDELVSNIIYS